MRRQVGGGKRAAARRRWQAGGGKQACGGKRAAASRQAAASGRRQAGGGKRAAASGRWHAGKRQAGGSKQACGGKRAGGKRAGKRILTRWDLLSIVGFLMNYCTPLYYQVSSRYNQISVYATYKNDLRRLEITLTLKSQIATNKRMKVSWLDIE